VVTALRLEERAVRRAAPDIRVVRVGVGATSAEPIEATGVVLSVGLGGALTEELAPGTVVVPDRVADEAGGGWAMDPAWSDALRAASHRLGFPTAAGALVSTAEVVTGEGRTALAQQGYAAVDMEPAAVAAQVRRLAVIRVVLDTPSHEISPRWSRPALAAIDPRLWPQAFWLARNSPRFAARAAAVLAEVLRGDALEGDVDPEV
jgi:hypothetical protein